MLPEGTYQVTYTACRACPPGSTPDYLLAFSQDVQGTVTIAGAAPSGATLLLVEMRESGSRDILGFFADAIIALKWNEVHAAFLGVVDYGGAAEFIPIFRRDGERLECDFDVFHLKHDVGATTCAVAD